jgi:hypothetical protein
MSEEYCFCVISCGFVDRRPCHDNSAIHEATRKITNSWKFVAQKLAT